VDFLAIYRIKNMYKLSGQKFCKYASRLLFYKGAVRGQIEKTYREQEAEGPIQPASYERQTPQKQTMSMREAAGLGKADVLEVLNQESMTANAGQLFEMSTVSV
jgi:hypothetical protein